jgi:DNA-binding NarL/FixJ family response regulator
VLALTIHDDATHRRTAREAGADGYVIKEAAARELATAICAAARGAVAPRAHAMTLAGEGGPGASAPGG